MEAAIQTMVKVYLKSSKGKESLGKKEFQNLVKGQLSHILSDADSKEAINNMGQGLDADQDGKVGFEEYMKLVGYLAVSLSEQRSLAKEEPGLNAESAQAAQSVPVKDGDKPEANGEAQEEAKPEEVKAEAAPAVKVEANAEPKVEVNGEPKLDLKLDGAAVPVLDLKAEASLDGNMEAKVEEATEPKAPKEEEEKPADAAAVAGVEGAATTVMEVLTKEKVEVEEKVEVVAEEVVAAGEEVEKKVEEATS